MKKINLKQTNEILLRISIFFIIISIICGISIDISFFIKLNSLPEMNIDNSDFSIFFKMVGYMILPIISIAILVFCVAGALIVDGIIWGIYGLIRIIKKLIKEKRWNVFIAVGIVMTIVYNSWLPMQNGVRYEETDVDKYLIEEFLERFDNKLLSKISNTELTFFEYDENREYKINRQFFILSFSELDSNRQIYGNQTKSKMNLKYFDDNSRIANNDIGIESPYWTRTSHYSDSYYMVGYTGAVTYTGSGARFGVRPAFTIPTNTKITNLYDEFLMQNIYVFDI